MWYPAKGKVRSSKEWLVLDTPNSIPRYYSFWVKKFTWKNVSLPLWGSHITCIAGKYQKVSDHPLWGTYDGEIVPFEYSNVIETGKDDKGTYFWLPVRCKRLEEIRLSFGLTPKPKWNWHLTICYLNY
jgi:hypothetical protein